MTSYNAYRLSKEWAQRPDATLLVITATEKAARSFRNDLEFFANGRVNASVCQFEAPDTLPYSHLSSSQDIWIDRLKILNKLCRHEPVAVIASIEAVLRRCPPQWIFSKYVRTIRQHEPLDRVEFLNWLNEAGYINQPLVEDEGAYSVRGGIIDLFSPIADRPARIELDCDEIASIRFFDPVTQRSSMSISSCTIIPARNIILNKETKEHLLLNLKELCDTADIKPTERREFAESIEHGFYPQAAETLIPLFYEKTASITDYLPKDAIIYIDDEIETKAETDKFLNRLHTARAEAKHIEKIVRVEELYDGWRVIARSVSGCEAKPKQTPARRFLASLGTGSAISSIQNYTRGIATSACGGLAMTAKGRNDIKSIITQLRHWQKTGLSIIITCHTTTQADRMIDILRFYEFAAKIADKVCHSRESGNPFNKLDPHFRGDDRISIMLGSLSGGFVSIEDRLAILTDEEIFGSKVSKRAAPSEPISAFADFSQVREHDLVVHKEHGIGRYLGLKNMEVGGAKNDFLHLQYLGGDKLYLPTWKINLISRYIGDAETVALDRLGGKRWSETQKKVTAAIRTMAMELLKIYAARKVEKGFSFSPRDEMLEEFEAAFPYDETPDQWRSIEDVLKDMHNEKPADRLICGDVGYGKTEVAMRAAFKAVADNKQVAVLVPTTILAFQHYENFIARFAKWPVRIEMLSRFRSRTEQKHVVDELARGMVNIIIGTHRLLQKDVHFHDLGLLVIDEEHRFGVAHKERIRKLKTTVDTIAMTATPIPRTLHMSFSGIREISIINTPPANRLSIRTYVAEFDDGLVRSAIMAELARGGQIYFVHNRVESIEKMHAHISKIVPEARIAVAHGQMKEGELEDIMMKFLQRHADVLLCTTIIESGLDIPSANTIIINRADCMGLSQLYQLRGRVGRSNVQAYAYLLTPNPPSPPLQRGEHRSSPPFEKGGSGGISPVAQKRLALLQRYTELGSGFQIAMHDLEIRGAGNLLGTQQSGHINAIGYEMYVELLEKTINRLQGKEEKPQIDTEISLPVQAYIPADYVEDEGTRLVLYRRLAAANSHEVLDSIAAEITDRFGAVPELVKNLFGILELKLITKKLIIESIQFSNGIFVLKFNSVTPVKPATILELVKKYPNQFLFKPPVSLFIKKPAQNSQEILSQAKAILRVLD